MKKALLHSLLLILFGQQVFSQVLLKLSNDTLRSLYYNGGDEFNALAVNTSDWHQPYHNLLMGQFFIHDPANIRIENGVAVFSLERKDTLCTLRPDLYDSSFLKRSGIKITDNQFRAKYTAGMIISKRKYHYGVYELRFKVEKGKGVWPAFWFYAGVKNEEIDAFELKGEKNNKIHVDTHCPYGCDNGYRNKLGIKTNWGDWMPVSNYLHDGFNIFLLDWKPGEITWFINGYPLAHFKGDFPHPMSMLINTQVSSKYSAFQPGPDENMPCPNNFYVDYVRAWQYTSDAAPVVLKTAVNMDISNRFATDYKNRALRHRGLLYIRKKFKAEKGMLSLVLLPENKLRVCLLGDLNNPSTQLIFKGEHGIYEVKSGEGEKDIVIDAREKELELQLKTTRKIYSKKIIISP